MLDFKLDKNVICFGTDVKVSFQRTLRISDDGQSHPLPPGLGHFPLKRVEDYLDSVPPAWKESGGIFFPMYQSESLFLAFQCNYSKPHVIKVGVDMVNALDGKPWTDELVSHKQNYMLLPKQLWLDGVYGEKGQVLQFKALPLDVVYASEPQENQDELGDMFGDLQLLVVAPVADKFSDIDYFQDLGSALSDILGDEGKVSHKEDLFNPDQDDLVFERHDLDENETGLGKGCKMTHKIAVDGYGLGTWDPEQSTFVPVHIVNSLLYEKITGEPPPPTPICTDTYKKYNLPWYDFYNEVISEVKASDILDAIKAAHAAEASETDEDPQTDEGAVETDSPEAEEPVSKPSEPEPVAAKESSLPRVQDQPQSLTDICPECGENGFVVQAGAQRQSCGFCYYVEQPEVTEPEEPPQEELSDVGEAVDGGPPSLLRRLGQLFKKNKSV